MAFSRDNTLTMLITLRATRLTSLKSLKLKLQDRLIPTVEDTRLLGVHIDNHLTWKKQISHVIQLVNYKPSLLRCIKKHLPLRVHITVYITFMFDHTRNPAVVYWASVPRNIILHNKATKKTAARLILDREPGTSSAHLFQQLQWCYCFQREFTIIRPL